MEKENIKLSVVENNDITEAYIEGSKPLITQFGADTEEAIISAIDYLIENDLIK